MYFVEQRFTDQKITKILLYQYLQKFKPHENVYDYSKWNKMFLKDFS